MFHSYQTAQTYTRAKYPAAKVQVEAMVFSDLVESINQAYKDRDFLALQYLGTCLSSSVFGRSEAPVVVAADLPKTVAQLHREINAAYRKKDFSKLHHLGNKLASISILEHAVQPCA